jgi:hypothetical protein
VAFRVRGCIFSPQGQSREQAPAGEQPQRPSQSQWALQSHGTGFSALTSLLAILRALVKSAAEKDPSALQLLLRMLPAVDALLADVQAALGRRN